MSDWSTGHLILIWIAFELLSNNGYFLNCCNHMPVKNNWREEGSTWTQHWRVQSVTDGMAKVREVWGYNRRNVGTFLHLCGLGNRHRTGSKTELSTQVLPLPGLLLPDRPHPKGFTTPLNNVKQGQQLEIKWMFEHVILVGWVFFMLTIIWAKLYLIVRTKPMMEPWLWS